MLLTTVMIGGIFLMAAAVAGLLMFYQLQQSTDFGNSTIAIFAADAALEKALFDYFNSTAYLYPNCSAYGCAGPNLTLSNGASGTSAIATGATTTVITSTGRDVGSRTIRLLQTTLQTSPQ